MTPSRPERKMKTTTPTASSRAISCNCASSRTPRAVAVGRDFCHCPGSNDQATLRQVTDMTPNADQTVREIATENPAAIRIFESFGIDYCCNGARSLEDACAESRVPMET